MPQSDIFRDERFQQLSPGAKLRVLRRIDPSFQQLSPGVQERIVGRFSAPIRERTPSPTTPQHGGLAPPPPMQVARQGLESAREAGARQVIPPARSHTETAIGAEEVVPRMMRDLRRRDVISRTAPGRLTSFSPPYSGTLRPPSPTAVGREQMLRAQTAAASEVVDPSRLVMSEGLSPDIARERMAKDLVAVEQSRRGTGGLAAGPRTGPIETARATGETIREVIPFIDPHTGMPNIDIIPSAVAARASAATRRSPLQLTERIPKHPRKPPGRTVREAIDIPTGSAEPREIPRAVRTPTPIERQRQLPASTQIELPPPVTPAAHTRAAAAAATTPQQVSMTPESATHLGTKFIERSAGLPANSAEAVRLREQGENLLKWAESKQGVTDTEQLKFPWVEGGGASSRQGEFWTGTAGADVPPQARVYSSQPRSPEVTQMAAENRAARQQAEEIAARPLPEPPKRMPPAYPETPGQRQARQTAEMGYRKDVEVVPPASGVMRTRDEQALLSTYPRLKERATTISRGLRDEQQMLDEIAQLGKVTPTARTAARTQELQDKLARKQMARSRLGRTRKDEERILEETERLENLFSKGELQRARQQAGPTHPKGVRPQQPHFTRQFPSETPPPPTPPGAPPVPPRDAPLVGGPEGTGVPSQMVNNPGLFKSRLKRPLEVLEDISPITKGLSRKMDLGLTEGRLSGNMRSRRFIRAGADKLSDSEDMNVMNVLQGIEQPESLAAKKVVDESRAMLDDMADELERFKGPGGEGYMVSNDDGSEMVFTRLANGKYAPHIHPPARILKDANNPQTIRAVQGMLRRGDADTLEEAQKIVRDHVALAEGSQQEPSALIRHFMTKRGLSRTKAMEAAQAYRKPGEPRKFGQIDYHRSEVPSPVYEPSSMIALDSYFKRGSERIEMARQIGQSGKKVEDALDALLAVPPEQWADPNFTAKKGWSLAKKQIDSILGTSDNPRDQAWDNFWGLLRTLSAFKIGPATTVANSFQDALWGSLMTDPTTTAQAIWKTLRKTDIERALMGGADKATAAKLARLEAGLDTSTLAGRWQNAMSKQLDRYLKWTAFSQSEMGQRVIGHHIGEIWADKMAKRLARNADDVVAREELAKLLLDPDEVLRRHKAGEPLLSDREALRSGMKMSDIINFSSRAEDIPADFNGALGRTLWQFKTFAYGTTRLTWESLQGLRGGPRMGRAWRNLALMATIFPMSGEAVGFFRDLQKHGTDVMKKRYGEEWKSNPGKMYLENLAENGLFAMASSALQGAAYGRLAEGLSGPVFGTGLDLSEEAVRALFSDRSTEENMLHLAKAAVQNAPGTATLVYPWFQEQFMKEWIEDARRKRPGSAPPRRRGRGSSSTRRSR